MSENLDNLIERIYKKFHTISINNIENKRDSILSTNFKKLNYILGCNGLPKGKIIEIFGKEAIGKTTLALHLIRYFQEINKTILFVNIERAFDRIYAKNLGINLEKLLIFTPQYAEDLFIGLKYTIESKDIDIIILDSFSAITTKCESMIKKLDTNVLSNIIESLQILAQKHQTSIIILNQIRSTLNNTITTNNRKLKSIAAIRVLLSNRRILKYNDKIVGIEIAAETVKNKIAQPFKKETLTLLFHNET